MASLDFATCRDLCGTMSDVAVFFLLWFRGFTMLGQASEEAKVWSFKGLMIF